MRQSLLVAILVLAAFLPAYGQQGLANRATPPVQDETFSFTVMGDTTSVHYWPDDAEQPEVFRRTVDEVNRLNADFTVLNGDLIRGSDGQNDEARVNRMWDGFDATCAKFKRPYYQVVGNHDVENALMERIYVKRYGKRFPLWYSFDHKECHFVVLNSDEAGKFRANVAGPQWEWLKKDLEAHKTARRIFVFIHRPLWEYGGHNWKHVHPLLAKYKVDTVFAAHRHGYRRDATRGGVRYVISGNIGLDRASEGSQGYFCGQYSHYCLVTVRGKNASIAVVKPGYIDNENIATKEDWSKSKMVMDALRPKNDVRVKRGGKPPGEITYVIPNPFDEKLDGTLTFRTPKGSGWKLPNATFSVAPGSEEKLTISLMMPREAVEPFPVAVWSLAVGDRNEGKRILVRNMTTETIDPWPYAENRQGILATNPLRRLVRRRRIVKNIEAKPGLSTTLKFTRKNPTKWPMVQTLTWRFPAGCRWNVSPATRTLHLAADESRELECKVSFAGAMDKVFPLPRLDTVVTLDGTKAMEFSERLPARARAYYAGKVLTLKCVRAGKSPVIDGQLDDAAWKKAPAASRFVLPMADGATDYPTEARFAYDAVNLYVSFRCAEPNVAGLVADETRHDGRVWTNDSIEMLLDTNLDRKTFYQWVINPRGVISDNRNRKHKWNGLCLIKTGRERNAWTLEAAIPWKTLDVKPPKSGTKMGLELVRNRAQDPSETSMWSPTFKAGGWFGPSYIIKRYGTLVFE